MHILSPSFLAAVKQKLGKAPHAEALHEELQNEEGASLRFASHGAEGIGNVPETLALATTSPSKHPRDIHEVVNPFINSADTERTDQKEILDLSGQGLEPAIPAIIVSANPASADGGAGKGAIGESSPGHNTGKSVLHDLFVRKSVRNPLVKALLKRHQPVNTRALSNDLKEFALRLGLSPPKG